jgi:hypothetical protein
MAILWATPAQSEVIWDTTAASQHKQALAHSGNSYFSGITCTFSNDVKSLNVEFIVGWVGDYMAFDLAPYRLVAMVQSTNAFIDMGRDDPEPIAKIAVESLGPLSGTNWSLVVYEEIPSEMYDGAFYVHNYRLKLSFELSRVVRAQEVVVIAVGFPYEGDNLYLPALVGSTASCPTLPAGVLREPLQYTREMSPASSAFDVPQVKIDAIRADPPLLISSHSAGSSLALSWPASLSTGAVEAATSLLGTNSWVNVHNITSETNRFVVPIESGVKFFRLRVP